MRGKGQKVPIGSTVSGITPAYAGKRLCKSSKSCLQEDHPRLCGEKKAAAGDYPKQKGSPPPMRGKVNRRMVAAILGGITPAYAGKRDTPPLSTSASWDHPRLCGEKDVTSNCNKPHKGSPPPMRGKVVRAIPDILRKRITPAYAGKSRQQTRLLGVRADHPRLCGEKSFCTTR